MASKTSKVSVVDRGTAGGKSYYKTDVTTLADGSVQRETYRTDAQGNNSVRIQSVTVNSEGTVTKDEVSSNATVNEQRDLRNPKSQLRQGIKNQVNTAAGELAESYGNAPAHNNSGGRLFVGNSAGNGNIIIGGEYCF